MEYHNSTYGIWHQLMLKNTPKKEPNYISELGSKYWEIDNYIYRLSDHWGKVADCYWVIKTPNNLKHDFFSLEREHPMHGTYLGYWRLARVKKSNLKLIQTMTIDSDIDYLEGVNVCEFGKVFKSNVINFKDRILITEHPNHNSKSARYII